MTDVGLLSAFAAGVLALLSPCSALLLPSFFAYAVRQPHGPARCARRRSTLGLLLTLVPLGTGAAAASSVFYGHRGLLIAVAGWTIIALGVLQLLGGGFALPFGQPAPDLVAATRRRLRRHWVSTVVLGAVYGLAGFCSGPVLGAILTMAAAQELARRRAGCCSPSTRPAWPRRCSCWRRCGTAWTSVADGGFAAGCCASVASAGPHHVLVSGAAVRRHRCPLPALRRHRGDGRARWASATRPTWSSRRRRHVTDDRGRPAVGAPGGRRGGRGLDRLAPQLAGPRALGPRDPGPSSLGWAFGGLPVSSKPPGLGREAATRTETRRGPAAPGRQSGGPDGPVALPERRQSGPHLDALARGTSRTPTPGRAARMPSVGRR